MQQQIRTIGSGVQSSFDRASPTVAAHVATGILIGAVLILFCLIYLLVSLPVRMLLMQREIRTLKEKTDSVLNEVRLSDELLMNSRAEESSRHDLESVPAKSHFDQYDFVDRPTKNHNSAHQ